MSQSHSQGDSQSHSDNASRYRRQARMCGVLAACAHSSADGERLMRMRTAYLGRAATEDCLDGLPSLPPASVCALAVVR